MTPKEFMAGATVTPLGADWGTPLWRFENGDVSVEVHADGEDAARAAALEALPQVLGEQA